MDSTKSLDSSLSGRVAALLIAHDDHWYLTETIASLQGKIPAFVFVNKFPFFAEPGDWQKVVDAAERAGATVVVGEWQGEIEHRSAAGEHLLSLGFTHALLPDGDEIIEPRLLDTLLKIAESDLADVVTIRWDTYWKTPEFVIRPREGFTPSYLANLSVAAPVAGHQYRGGRMLFLDESYGLVHHLSWVGPEERIQRKLDSWAHAKEVLPGWRERVWRAWDSDKTLRDIHPTHPHAYSFAERLAEAPEPLKPLCERWNFTELLPLVPIEPFPAISVVIPVYGGADDLASCLTSLAPLHAEGLLNEVLVIDDAGPQESEIQALADSHPFVRLTRKEENGGFAEACNTGASQASGEAILFLNSDTRVPRTGFLRLAEALVEGGPLVAAVGPLSNHAGHGQGIPVTYTAFENLDAFAEEFARRDVEDADTDMLVGFCLLVRKDAFRRADGFDTRFGRGLFEDNDLCYKLRREGWKLTLAARAFVHHEGSKSLERAIPDVSHLLESNQRVYTNKWRADLQSGFASHLSGLGQSGRIRFDPARKPEARLQEARRLAKQADISLIMIVKNEERVLGDCLSSAMPFFHETIVVDTGSTDRTVEIAERAGAIVKSFPWTESFAEARNESLRHATGRWILWLDADDTIDIAAGEAIQRMALEAPPEVMAFVIPVQFVEENGLPGGTRVDHVKLFRSHPALSFEGRIHEQILPSLKIVFGESGVVARGPAEAVVLHSGYDTSVEGQAKKRQRDATILALELQERPDHPFVLFNLGMTDHYGQQHTTAIEWLSKCISVSRPTESHIRKAYALKAVSLRELGRIDEALATLEEGLAAVGDDPELHFQSGYTLTMQGKFAEARASYEKALQGDLGGHFSSVDTAILGYKGFYNLAQVCQQMGDWPAARGWLERALAEVPEFLPALFALFDGALEAGDFTTLSAALAEVLRREGPSENWAKMGVRQAEKVGGEQGGEGFLRVALQTFPEALGPKLALMRRLIETGRDTEATGLLHELQAAGVPEAAFFLGVQANRRGNFPEALHWMERASELNPGHGETLRQVENLKGALGLAPRFTEQWFDPECQRVLKECAEEVKDLEGAIIEIGCWEGRSTICLANAVAPQVVHAVDHWEGNGTEGYDHPTVLALAQRDVFGRFQENIAQFTPGNVQIHRESSASFFSHFHEPVKLVHIDGSHDYESVKADIEAALRLLVPGGVICGHDADAPGVQKAAGELFESTGATESQSIGMWTWKKWYEQFDCRSDKQS
ncbi:MAG: glycosyltransferase [Armatimonas sp.]